MQADDMEVPIINNLNDNGDRLRPKGKDAFKDQQKESEVNRRGVCVHSAACSIWKVRARVCCCWGALAFRPAECPFHAVGLGSKQACMHEDWQADTEVLLWQPAPINNPAVILRWCTNVTAPTPANTAQYYNGHLYQWMIICSVSFADIETWWPTNVWRSKLLPEFTCLCLKHNIQHFCLYQMSMNLISFFVFFCLKSNRKRWKKLPFFSELKAIAQVLKPSIPYINKKSSKS